MREFAITLEGLTPLVMHSAAMMLEPKEDKGRDPLQWERENMRKAAYINDAGNLYIPSIAIMKMAIQGCGFVTRKPKGTRKGWAALLEATLQILDDAVIENVGADKLVEYVVNVSLNPSLGRRSPRGPRCRPLVPLPWRAQTLAILLDEAVSADDLGHIFDVAGRLVGLLDSRTLGKGRASITVTPL
jgi:hypothetical protein